MTNLPKTQAPPPAGMLTIRPVAVEHYTDLLRGRRIVRLCYRRRDVTQARALSFVADVISDVTRAGLVVTADVEAAISLENVQGKARVLQSGTTRCKLNVKVQVQPVSDDSAEVQAWADGLRAKYVPAGEDSDAAG